MTLCADITVQRGPFTLDAHLSVEAGEVLAILGPNGSGKTTMLRTIAGLTPIHSGRISLDEEVFDDPHAGIFVAPEQRPIGVVFQQYLLFEHLSALENVAFGLRARGMARAEARQRAQRWLERVGLGDRGPARPRELSGGQAQRVAVARALATDPRILLLDEPLAALDIGSRRQVRRDLRRYLDGFDGVRLLVTHDPIDAYALAQRIAVVENGTIVQSGTIAEITAHPRSRYVAELIGSNLIAGMVGHDSISTADGVRLSVVADFTGPGFGLIRPQSILVARELASTSARNVLSGPIDDIDRLGDRVRLGIAAPIHLIAEITATALESMQLRLGDVVHTVVKATDIEVYPA